jgi:hypothetical protein
VLDAPFGEYHAGEELDDEYHPNPDVNHRTNVFPSGADLRVPVGTDSRAASRIRSCGKGHPEDARRPLAERRGRHRRSTCPTAR